jgi:hypothetical protein
VGVVAYRLQLPVGTKLHDVFHVNQLKKHVGPNVVPNPTLPVLIPDGKIKVAPKEILQRRQIPLLARDYDIAVDQRLIH